MDGHFILFYTNVKYFGHEEWNKPSPFKLIFDDQHFNFFINSLLASMYFICDDFNLKGDRASSNPHDWFHKEHWPDV